MPVINTRQSMVSQLQQPTQSDHGVLKNSETSPEKPAVDFPFFAGGEEREFVRREIAQAMDKLRDGYMQLSHLMEKI